MRIKNFTRRFLSTLLLSAMILSSVPFASSAEEIEVLGQEEVVEYIDNSDEVIEHIDSPDFVEDHTNEIEEQTENNAGPEEQAEPAIEQNADSPGNGTETSKEDEEIISDVLDENGPAELLPEEITYNETEDGLTSLMISGEVFAESLVETEKELERQHVEYDEKILSELFTEEVFDNEIMLKTAAEEDTPPFA